MVEGYFTYFIIFKASYGEYTPIMKYEDIQEIREAHKGTMHLFDKDLESVLPALEYVMHLPRLFLDLFNLDEDIIDVAYDESHEIILVPDSVFIKLKQTEISVNPTLIIYTANCDKNVTAVSETFNPILGIYEINNLNEALLKKQWNELYNYTQNKDYEMVSDINIHYWLKNEYLKALPLMFLARQYGNTNEVLQEVFNSINVEEKCVELQYRQIAHQRTLMNLHESGIHDLESASLRYDGIYLEEMKAGSLNVVITFPGIPKKQMRYGGLASVLPDSEKKVIRIMGIHRAIAKNGILIELGIADEKIYKMLNELELRCKEGTNNNYIWKALNDFGKVLGTHFRDFQLAMLLRAKHVTIFSDLPIGLAIIAKTEVPIQCYKSISYRPLTPLTRNLEIEMVKCRQHYLGKKCKVAFAECILPNEENRYVRPMSEIVIQTLENMVQTYPDFIFKCENTYNIKDLEEFIYKNIDADILYISAHGHYNPQRNMAGLMIGEEFWMADNNFLKVPPIVILSACHVSPRGSGAVNVADMFMRSGAITVLGTFIPVNAKRNTILMTRLFTYILEGQTGSKQYKTLADAWSGVVSTNAIHELLQSSKKFETWMYGENPNGNVRMVEFQLKRSVGRLHPTTIYSDTVKIVKEMLKEENMEGKFNDILDGKNYFPESIFYQFIGFPENVFIYNDIFKEAIENMQIDL